MLRQGISVKRLAWCLKTVCASSGTVVLSCRIDKIPGMQCNIGRTLYISACTVCGYIASMQTAWLTCMCALPRLHPFHIS